MRCAFKVLMALLEIRRPMPQAGGFYQYTMSEEQVGLIISIYQDIVIEMLFLCRLPHNKRLTDNRLW